MSNDVNKLNSLKDEATPLSYSRWNTHSSILSSSSSSSNEENGELKQSLKRYGFGSRIVTLTNTDLAENGALPAEMYEGKNLKLCLIVGLKAPSFSSPSWDENNEKPPLLEVLVMDDDGLLQEKKIVDIGASYQYYLSLLIIIDFYALPCATHVPATLFIYFCILFLTL